MHRKVKIILNPMADMGNAWRIARDLRSITEQHGGVDWSERDSLPILSGFCCTLFPRGPGANDDQIKFFRQISLSKYSSK